MARLSRPRPRLWVRQAVTDIGFGVREFEWVRLRPDMWSEGG
jgi:hypothetical protein